MFYRITQNNWIGVYYTRLDRSFHNFLWALLVHINFLNNSCNFILYVVTGPSFRKQLIEMFTFSKKQTFTRTTTTTKTNHTVPPNDFNESQSSASIDKSELNPRCLGSNN